MLALELGAPFLALAGRLRSVAVSGGFRFEPHPFELQLVGAAGEFTLLT